MAAKKFDLVDAISDLLRRIAEGRQTVRQKKSVSDDFWSACDARDKAQQFLQQWLSDGVAPEAKAEFDRRASELKDLTEEANRLWNQFTETIAFIRPFQDDVKLLLARLPLKPEWNVYREAVRSLNVSDHGSWTDTPKDSVVDLLEMRLGEMLDLASRTQMPGNVSATNVPAASTEAGNVDASHSTVVSGSPLEIQTDIEATFSEAELIELRKNMRAQRLRAAKQRWYSVEMPEVPFTWIYEAARVDKKDASNWKTGKMQNRSEMARRIEDILKQPNPPKPPAR